MKKGLLSILIVIAALHIAAQKLHAPQILFTGNLIFGSANGMYTQKWQEGRRQQDRPDP